MVVEHRGPDSVRNGIALSGTVHWMFDRGLLSIDDDYAMLVARDRLTASSGYPAVPICSTSQISRISSSRDLQGLS